MITLREAAQQALEALCCVRDMVAHPDNLEFIDKQTTALRAALAEPDLFHCPKCGGPADNGHDRSIPPSPYFCTKCMAEPKQDGCDHCNHPLYAAVKCKVCGRVTEPVQEPYAWMSVGGSIWRHKTTEDDVPLYTAPRKPLAEWQINDLMSDIDPEDRDSWSFRQGVYAAEKHHGVRR